MWVLTTAALGVAVPAAWAQHNVIDEAGYATLATSAAKDPAVQSVTGSVGGGGFGVGDSLTKSGGDTVAAADDAEADAFVDAVRGFGQKILVDDAQDSSYFRRRPFPIRGRKREEGQSVNAQTRRSLDYGARGLGAGTMPGGAGQAAGRGPAAVAIGDDGYVDGSRRRDIGLKHRLHCRNVLLGKDR